MKVADETVSTFNAGASMLGYLYQVRVALLWAIRQSGPSILRPTSISSSSSSDTSPMVRKAYGQPAFRHITVCAARPSAR